MSLGDLGLLLLFVKMAPFDWTDSQYTMYGTIKGLLTSIGMILLPVLLSRLPVHGRDSVLVLIGVAASAAVSMGLSLARTSWIVVLIGSFSFFSGAIAPGYRSMIPKMVAADETARLFSAFSMVMTACPIISTLVFNNVYKATLNVWPGFVFFLGGLIEIAVFVGQLIVHFLMRPAWRRQEDESPVPNDDDDQRALLNNQETDELYIQYISSFLV